MAKESNVVQFPIHAEGMGGLPPKGGCPLSRLNSNNSNTNPFDTLNNTNSSYHRKLRRVLEENIDGWVKQVGVDNVGFLTLTFQENIEDKKEADRRFNSFATGVLGKHFGAWVKVCERQKRGAWHFHILIDCKVDIRTGYNPKRGKRKRSANPALRNYWRILGEKYKSYGFGFRSELEPMKSNSVAIAKYVSKYVEKHLSVRRKEDKGKRLISYSKDFPRAWRLGFMFLGSGSKLWRRKLADIARFLGAATMDDLAEMLGEKWAYKMRPIIARWVYPPESYDSIKEYELDYRLAELATGYNRALNEKGDIIGWDVAGTVITDRKSFSNLLHQEVCLLLDNIPMVKMAA